MNTTHDSTRNYWDQLADDYQEQTHISCEDVHFGPLLPGDRQLHLLPQPLDGRDCLELGCGAAQNSIALARQGAHCTAVDLSTKQLAHAQTLAQQHHVQLRLLQADLQTFDPHGETFDLVHSCHALEFASDPQQALAHMATLLRPGGTLLLTTVHPLSAGEWVSLEDEDGLLLKDYFNPTPDARELSDNAHSQAQPLTIDAITSPLIRAGLTITHIVEQPCTLLGDGSDSLDDIPYWSPAWLEHAPELQRIPYTLIVVAQRPAIPGTPPRHEPTVAELAAKRRAMTIRAKASRAVHDFFDALDFTEVFTPVRIPAPALEDYIDAEPSGTHWLRTSPELHMKRLLAAGMPRIYQLGPCFRMHENGSRHLPEFQMLEWYRRQDHWRTVLADAQQLLRHVALAVNGSTRCRFRNETIDFAPAWDEITVDDAFRQWAGVPLDQAIADGRFEELLCERIEPHLGHGRPTALTEYPLACSGLSQPIPGRPDRVERWEVYVAGLELGNACSELVDPDEQLRRFQATAQLRADDAREVYPLDEPFMDAIRSGIPPSAGVAIGFDRLVMLLANLDDIHDAVFD